jgi:hypothetical protein
MRGRSRPLKDETSIRSFQGLYFLPWRFRIFCSQDLAKFRNDALGVGDRQTQCVIPEKIAAKQDFYPESPRSIAGFLQQFS